MTARVSFMDASPPSVQNEPHPEKFRSWYFHGRGSRNNPVCFQLLGARCPISSRIPASAAGSARSSARRTRSRETRPRSTSSTPTAASTARRSEEHTSELQSLAYLVCRLLLEKKKRK